MAEPKIVTDYWAKPIPNRSFDWSAWYDGRGDEDGPIGYGATEQAAIDDLKINHPPEDMGP